MDWTLDFISIHNLLLSYCSKISYTTREIDISTGLETPVSTGRMPGTAWAVLNASAFKFFSTGQTNWPVLNCFMPTTLVTFLFPFLFSFSFLFHSIVQCITNFRITESHFTRVTTITRFHYTRIKILFDKSQGSHDYTTITTFHFTVFTRLYKNHKMLTRFHFSLPFSGYRFFIPNIQFKEGPLPLLLLLGWLFIHAHKRHQDT